jgi:hypothetical protein
MTTRHSHANLEGVIIGALLCLTGFGLIKALRIPPGLSLTCLPGVIMLFLFVLFWLLG